MRIVWGLLGSMLSLHAQDTLPSYDKEIVALEQQLQEIKLQKTDHKKNKKALKKQLDVHNKRTMHCNNVRIHALERRLEELESNKLLGKVSPKKEKVIEELTMELLILKSNTHDLAAKFIESEQQ